MTEAEKRRRMLERAAELQAREDLRRAAAREDENQRVAAGEAGIEPQFFEEAERQLDWEARVAAERARTRRRWAVGAVAVVGVGAGVWGASAVLAPAPAPPFVASMDDPSAWAADVNAGTVATLRFEPEAGRGQVAVVEVGAFRPGTEPHRLNVDSHLVPASFEGLTDLEVDLAGTLPFARVYLEAGDARWRSPALPVSAEWATRSVPLSAFDHQVRGPDGKWKTVGPAAIQGVHTLSVKLGDFVNDPAATGVVRIDELELK